MLRERSQAPEKRCARARDRVSAGGGRTKRAHLSAADDHFGPSTAPAQELAALYHERWEIETSLDELKTHLRGAQIVLRSKTPELVYQEFYGLMMAHFAIRGLMHEAALKADEDADKLSFLHAVRVMRRKLPLSSAIPPCGVDRFP